MVFGQGSGAGWYKRNSVCPGHQPRCGEIHRGSNSQGEREQRQDRTGTPDDPKLPPDSVDAVLLLKVYHEVAHPLVLMANLKPALRSGAKIGIIDRNGNGTDHGLNSDVVKREMAEAGFRLSSSYDFTKADGAGLFPGVRGEMRRFRGPAC